VRRYPVGPCREGAGGDEQEGVEQVGHLRPLRHACHKQGGWAASQWRREYGFTDGKIIVRSKLVARGRRKRVDYLLFLTPNLPIALVEAKDNNHSIGSGVQQALTHAETLDVPFVFSSKRGPVLRTGPDLRSLGGGGGI
jgi:hypothetical protein